MGESEFELGLERKQGPKPFEPPPWEREAFEELQRLREAQRGSEVPGVAVPAATEEAAPERTEAEAKASPRDKKIDPKVLDGLLAELAAEEAQSAVDLGYVGIVSGALLAAIGALLVIWGAAGFAGARQSGMIGITAAGGLGVFGVLFTAIGGWLLYREFKKRGVL